MARVEMLDEDERHSSILRERVEHLRERFDSTGGGSDADDREVAGPKGGSCLGFLKRRFFSRLFQGLQFQSRLPAQAVPETYVDG